MKLVEENCLSKAMVHLGEHGLGDMSLPAIRAQLLRKTPQERRDWDGSGIDQFPRLVPGSTRDALKNLKRNAGVGADRCRAEYLLRLVRGEVDDAAQAAVLSAWGKFAEHVVNKDLPDWFYLVWTTVVQFARQLGLPQLKLMLGLLAEGIFADARSCVK